MARARCSVFEEALSDWEQILVRTICLCDPAYLLLLNVVGGSVRVPAAACGVFSLKPTPERLSYRNMANTVSIHPPTLACKVSHKYSIQVK